MEEYEITFNGDKQVQNMHHIGMNYNGNYYSVIFGEYVNGGFCCIPNWGVGCELAQFSDIFWNTESIGRALDDFEAGRAIAKMIATSQYV